MRPAVTIRNFVPYIHYSNHITTPIFRQQLFKTFFREVGTSGPHSANHSGGMAYGNRGWIWSTGSRREAEAERGGLDEGFPFRGESESEGTETRALPQMM